MTKLKIICRHHCMFTPQCPSHTKHFPLVLTLAFHILCPEWEPTSDFSSTPINLNKFLFPIGVMDSAIGAHLYPSWNAGRSNAPDSEKRSIVILCETIHCPSPVLLIYKITKYNLSWHWLHLTLMSIPVDMTSIPTIKNPTDPQGLFVFQTLRPPQV